MGNARSCWDRAGWYCTLAAPFDTRPVSGRMLAPALHCRHTSSVVVSGHPRISSVYMHHGSAINNISIRPSLRLGIFINMYFLFFEKKEEDQQGQ